MKIFLRNSKKHFTYLFTVSSVYITLFDELYDQNIYLKFLYEELTTNKTLNLLVITEEVKVSTVIYCVVHIESKCSV